MADNFLVLVGKKNLEVRPIAINKVSREFAQRLRDMLRHCKGEIVKRIVYNNPDADFIFCAGDDKVSCIVFDSGLYP